MQSLGNSTVVLLRALENLDPWMIIQGPKSSQNCSSQFSVESPSSTEYSCLERKSQCSMHPLAEKLRRTSRVPTREDRISRSPKVLTSHCRNFKLLSVPYRINESACGERTGTH